jgi:hypothetical protein
VKTRLQVQIQKREQDRDDSTVKNDQASTEDAHYDNALDAIIQILRKDGISGLYSGLESSIVGTASMNFTYFYWSTTARRFYESLLHSHSLSNSNSIVKELGIGAVGGAMAQLCTNPIAVISMRHQTRKASERKMSMWETTETIYSEDGWTGLWRGFKVNLILVSNPMITYGVYQWLRRGLVILKKEFGPLDAFRKFSLRLNILDIY